VPEDASLLAAAFEVEYPGYGFRLVLLAFATGLRICELLALRWDSIDLATGAVAVNAQLDRYRAWPAVRKPKGGKTRRVPLAGAVRDLLEIAARQAGLTLVAFSALTEEVRPRAEAWFPLRRITAPAFDVRTTLRNPPSE